MDSTVVRRIAGTASAVLLVALGHLGMNLTYAPSAGSYTVEATLGRAGSGLNEGTDVKARGVRIGQVESIRYDDGIAIATLRFNEQPRLPAPEDLELVVTAKTLLGEKQVELSFPDERFGAEPFLEAGDVLTAARPPTELQEVLDRLTPFIDTIDGQDLAAIVEALGEQQGEGEAIAENIELGQQLAAFGDRTAEQNLANLRALADIAEALEPRAADFNRMNDNLEPATSLIVERQDAVRDNLEALSQFAVGFAEFLEVEESAIDALLLTGDPVGAMLERQADNVGELVYGLFTYMQGLGKHGGDLTDGSEWAAFRIFLQQEDFDPFEAVCQELPDDVPFECPAAPEGDGG